MADNKSCEGKVTTLECMECGYREVFTERQFNFTDGLRCHQCEGLVKPSKTKPGEKINNRRIKKQDKARSVGTLTVDIDVSEAIKGLKAVQREAKKTVQALKDVEVKTSALEDLTDDDLIKILVERGWEAEISELSTDTGVKVRTIININKEHFANI